MVVTDCIMYAHKLIAPHETYIHTHQVCELVEFQCIGVIGGTVVL